MLENLIVAVIIAVAAAYVGGKYLPLPWRKKKASGCGSGCDTCGSCDEPQKNDPRVIKLHKVESEGG